MYIYVIYTYLPSIVKNRMLTLFGSRQRCMRKDSQQKRGRLSCSGIASLNRLSLYTQNDDFSPNADKDL